jgi:hypothetical protein
MGIVDEEELPLPTQQSILQLETALQLQFAKTGNQSITYPSFCVLAAKVQGPPVIVTPPPSTKVPAPTTKTVIGNDGSTSALSGSTNALDLSKAERLWHDLYCVAVPALYSASRKEEDSTLVLKVDTRLHKDNRLKELRRLLKETSTTSSSYQQASHRAFGMLQSVRPVHAVPPAKAQRDLSTRKKAIDTLETVTTTTPGTEKHLGSSNSSSQIDKLSGLTLEERVTAKARKREEAMQTVQDGKKDSKEDRLVVADALFYHASHTLRRRYGSSSSSKGLSSTSSSAFRAGGSSSTFRTATTRTNCVFTFKDVVQVLANQRSRQEVTRILQQIAALTPDWIQWTDPVKGLYGVPISKNATVSIATTDYKQVRAILAGELLPSVVEAMMKAETSSLVVLPSKSDATTTLLEEKSSLPVGIRVLVSDKRHADRDLSSSSPVFPTRRRGEPGKKSAAETSRHSSPDDSSTLLAKATENVVEPTRVVAAAEGARLNSVPADTNVDDNKQHNSTKRRLGAVTPSSPMSPNSKKHAASE